MKKAYAKINLDAILYNYRHLKCQFQKNIIAVLKDDAYGLGAVPIAKHLQNEEGIVFAVKDLHEAIQLRKAKIIKDILVLGVFEKEDLSKIKKYHLQVIVTTLKQLEELKDTSILFHLKVNTGMNRLGLSIEDFKKAFFLCHHHPQYCLKGIMTHFATADENHKQYQVFKEALQGLDCSSLMIHCFSSNSLQQDDLTNYCRVGIRLYGLFKRDLMLKNALEIVSSQKKETEEELDYIQSIVYELESASTLEDIQDIFEEISENVIFKNDLKFTEKSNNKNTKNQNSLKNPKIFKSSHQKSMANKKSTKKNKKENSYSPLHFEVDGFDLYVGKNNKENDWLTFNFANKSDIWFHTKDVHGSHVILKCGDIEVSDDTLVKCAKITAEHSKAKNSSNVPVDYCKVKFVRKPNGAKPGMVIFTNNKTIYVNPSST